MGNEALAAITSDLIDDSFAEFHFSPNGSTTCLSCNGRVDGEDVFENNDYFEHLGYSSLGLD